MDTNLLSAELVRAALAPLTLKEIDRLEELSTVPASTIYKIKLGTTANPGIETVGLFMPHIEAVLRERVHSASAASLIAAEASTTERSKGRPVIDVTKAVA